MPALPPERPGAVPPTPAVQAGLPPAPRAARAAGPPAAPAPVTRRGVSAVRQCPHQPQETRPLPDPAALRLCLIPDSAPPYDDEEAPDASAGGGSAADGGPGGCASRQPGQPLPAGQEPALPPAWPSRFAQVLAETLAGARPPRQMVPWTTEHARHSIQRLGPRLAAGQQPQVRRVVTSRPARDVLEMTVVVGFGPRVRALAVRLERAGPLPATPGRPAQQARWLCTAIEAA